MLRHDEQYTRRLVAMKTRGSLLTGNTQGVRSPASLDKASGGRISPAMRYWPACDRICCRLSLYTRFGTDDMALLPTPAPQFVRLAETQRAPVPFTLDGRACHGLVGDTILTAVLALGPVLRHADFSGEARAGFCLMGACQDCWVFTASGQRLRACTCFIAPGMHLLTRKPGDA